MRSLIFTGLAALLPAPQGADPGPVVLLAEEADESLVDELSGFAESAAVLVLCLEGAGRDCAAPAPEGASRRVLKPDDAIRSDDAELARAVREAELVAFGQGTLGEWYRTLWPGRRETELVRALWETHRGGATLVARGRAAGMLSAATVIDGPEEIGDFERNPRRDGTPRTAWSAGFQPWAVLDTEGAAGGSIGRLARVLVDDRLRLGVFLERESALVFDAAGQRFVARARGGVLVLDLRTSRRKQDALRGARFSRLLAGDAWVRRARRVVPYRGTPEAAVEDRTETVRVEHAFDARALFAALAVFDTAPVPARLVVEDGQRALTLEVDSNASVHPREGAGATLAGLAFDLEWTRP